MQPDIEAEGDDGEEVRDEGESEEEEEEDDDDDSDDDDGGDGDGEGNIGQELPTEVPCFTVLGELLYLVNVFIYLFLLGQAFLVMVQDTQLLGSSPGKPLVIQPYAGEEFEVVEDPEAGPGVKLGQLLSLSQSHLGSQLKGMCLQNEVILKPLMKASLQRG